MAKALIIHFTEDPSEGLRDRIKRFQEFKQKNPGYTVFTLNTEDGFEEPNIFINQYEAGLYQELTNKAPGMTDLLS